MNSEPNELREELTQMKARLAAIEAERHRARRKAGGGLLVATLVALAAGTVSAANGNCPNGLPFCFTPDSPALAGEVNHNFMQLKEWLETKVGAVSAAGVTASAVSAGSINATTLLSGAALQVPSGNQGTQLLWNSVTFSVGQTELINNKGLGSGGFVFYERQFTTSGAPTRLLDMNTSRANFSGSIGGNGALCVVHTACVEGNYVNCGQTTSCPNGKVMVGMTDGTSCSVANRAQCCSLALIACP